MFIGWKTAYIKKTILPKSIFTFVVIAIEITAGFMVEFINRV